jgi:hypothetical protein
LVVHVRPLVQFAIAVQPVHVTPSPKSPTLHAQLKLPVLLVQIATGLRSQLSVPAKHSLMSAHVMPPSTVL